MLNDKTKYLISKYNIKTKERARKEDLIKISKLDGNFNLVKGLNKIFLLGETKSIKEYDDFFDKLSDNSIVMTYSRNEKIDKLLIKLSALNNKMIVFYTNVAVPSDKKISETEGYRVFKNYKKRLIEDSTHLYVVDESLDLDGIFKINPEIQIYS